MVTCVCRHNHQQTIPSAQFHWPKIASVFGVGFRYFPNSTACYPYQIRPWSHGWNTNIITTQPHAHKTHTHISWHVNWQVWVHIILLLLKIIYRLCYNFNQLYKNRWQLEEKGISFCRCVFLRLEANINSKNTLWNQAYLKFWINSSIGYQPDSDFSTPPTIYILNV